MARLETQINQIFLSPADSKKLSLILYEEKLTANNQLFVLAELREIQKKTELNDLSRISEIIIQGFKANRKLDDEALFESTLAEINNQLADFAHKGRKSWLGKFSALVALKSGNNFYMANSGLTSAWLKRKNTLNEVLSPDKTQNQQPLKTFSNFSSGKLADKDSVVLCTSSVFNYVSVELFSKSLSGLELPQACANIAEILKSSAKSDEGFAVFMLGLTSQAVAPVVSAAAAPNTTLHPEEYAPLPVKSNWLKNVLTSWVPGKVRRPRPQAKPELNNQPAVAIPAVEIPSAVADVAQIAAKPTDSIKSKGSLSAKPAKNSAITPATKNPDNIKSVDKSISVTPQENLSIAHNIYAPMPEDLKIEKQQQRTELVLPIKPSITNPVGAIKQLSLPKFSFSKLFGWFPRIHLRLPFNLHLPRIKLFSNISGPAKFFLISFLVFAVLFGMNLAAYGVRKAQKAQEDKFNASAESLVNNLTEAESALLYKNQAEAMRYMSNAETELHKLEQIDVAKAQAFQTKFDDMNNKINRVTVLRNVTPAFEMPYSISFMARAGNGYLVANENPNSLGLFAQDKLDNLFMLNKTDGNITGVAHVSGQGNFVSSKDKIYKINQNTQEFQQVSYISNAELTNLKFSDPNRLYAINKSTNQVMRMTVSGGGISATQNVLKSNVNFATAQDLAIDTDVFVLFPDRVAKFVNGNEVTFNLTPISDPASAMTKMRIGNQIYLLEPVSNRVLIYNRKGELLNQVKFPTLNELTDIYIDEAIKEMLLINGNKVYRITF